MPAGEEESEMKQDREEGQAEKDDRGTTGVERRIGGKEEKAGWKEGKEKIKVAGKQSWSKDGGVRWQDERGGICA